MFHWLRMLLLVALVGGLGLRASGAHYADSCVAVEHGSGCCEGDGDKHAGSVVHEKDCPPKHHDHEHRHGECCTTAVWLSIDAGAASLFPPMAVAGRLRGGNETPPDGPVLALDKPPLI